MLKKINKFLIIVACVGSNFCFPLYASDKDFLPGLKKGFLNSLPSKAPKALKSTDKEPKNKAEVSLPSNDLKEMWGLVEYQQENSHEQKPKKSPFEGNIENCKKYYNYLINRKPYMDQTAPFEVGLKFSQLNQDLKNIVIFDDCWVKILLHYEKEGENLVCFTENSHEKHAQFIPDLIVWHQITKTFQTPSWGYFSFKNPETSEKSYRLYSLAPEDKEVISLFNSSNLSTYSVGFLKFKSDLSIITSNGFILDKNNALIQDRGWFFYLSGPNDISCNLYDYDPELKAMALYSMGGFPADYSQSSAEDNSKLEYLHYMIQCAGGIESVKEEGAIFLPQRFSMINEKVTVSQAKVLLPYLYQLRSIDSQEIMPSEATLLDTETLNLLIDKTEQIVFKEFYPKIKDIQEAEIIKELESAVTKDSSLSATEASKTSKKYKIKTKGKAAPTKGVKSEKNDHPSINKAEIEKQAKIKILEKIRNRYLEQSMQKKHFKSKEAGTILGQLAQSLSRVNINRLKETKTKGSHIGTGVVTEEGHSFYLNLVKRAEKEGFLAGTMKTIVNDYINKAIQAIIGVEKD